MEESWQQVSRRLLKEIQGGNERDDKDEVGILLLRKLELGVKRVSEYLGY